MNDGDLRGFVYPLEALRMQARWRLDGLLGELAGVLRRIAGANDDWTGMQREHRTLAARAAPSALGPVDPSGTQRVLLYLADLRKRMHTLRGTIVELESRRDALREQARTQQLELDGFECHRGERLDEHLALARHQSAVESDRDWLARSQWRQQTGNAELDA